MILKDCFYKRSLFVSFPSSKGNQIKIGLRSFPATWKKTLIWRWHSVKCCVRRDVSRVRYNGRSLNQSKPRTCLETQSNRTLLVRLLFCSCSANFISWSYENGHSVIWAFFKTDEFRLQKHRQLQLFFFSFVVLPAQCNLCLCDK